MRKRSWLTLPFIFVCLIYFSVERASAFNNDDPVAPEFRLKDLEGNEVALSDFKGKVIFLNFWATWCGPCKYEIPDFIEVYDKYNEKGLEIIGISLDRIGVGKLQNFVEEYKINYPIVLGSQKVQDDYKPGQFIPVTFIIDREGKIRHRQVGPMRKDTIEKIFLYLEEEK